MGKYIDSMNPIATLIAEYVLHWRVQGNPLIVGICGTQASGKSTAAAQVAENLSAKGLNVGVLSLDDLYLGKAARSSLAERVHPLFATRGPPGTHDVALGNATLDAVKRGEQLNLPRFDKRQDEPLPKDQWPLQAANCDVLLFEGWCVGARPQDEAALAQPVNELERLEDPDGVWRKAFNAHLAGPTGELFARIDQLIYLRPPNFEIVLEWRCQQERAYIATDSPSGASAAMTDRQVSRFIAHYERITRHIMDDMPARADLTIQLDAGRNVVSSATRTFSE
jgi:D-glycerate 3-kinase